MATPTWWDGAVCGFRYAHIASTSDVQDIIDTFRTEAVTHLGWTEPTSNHFVSPVDGGGRFFEIDFTRTSATKLTFVAIDDNGVTQLTRRFTLTSTPVSVDVYTGTHHLVLVAGSATPEFMHVALLDQYPDPWATNARALIANASHDTADTFFSLTVGEYFGQDGVTSANNLARRIPLSLDNSTVGIRMKAADGSIMAQEAQVYFNDLAGFRCGGIIPQMVMVPDDSVNGVDILLSIGDAGETGTFTVLPPTQDTYKLAIRKS